MAFYSFFVSCGTYVGCFTTRNLAIPDVFMSDVGVLNQKRHFKVLRDKLGMGVTTKEINDEDPKFKIGGILRISKYKSIFAKAYVTNWSKEVFVIKKKLKTLCCRYMLLVILKVKKLLELFTKNNSKKKKKKNQNEFRVEKIIKTKGDKLYVKLEGYNKPFNSWIDKKRIV